MTAHVNIASLGPDAQRQIAAERAPKPSKPSKYRNKPVMHNGVRFDSKAELKRWIELDLMERAGMITYLSRQVRYKLSVCGLHICTYVADFVYTDQSHAKVVEDVKGFRTKEYAIKKKLMKALYGIDVIEVRR